MQVRVSTNNASHCASLISGTCLGEGSAAQRKSAIIAPIAKRIPVKLSSDGHAKPKI